MTSTLEPWERGLQAIPGPIQYTSTALSGLFWDPPSHSTQGAARMVPMPLYTNTPPRPVSPVPVPPKPRLSLLPYPDLFDFAMYDSRASYTSTAHFAFGDFPADMTASMDAVLLAAVQSDAHSYRHKITPFPKISYDDTPSKTRPASRSLASQDLNCSRQTAGDAARPPTMSRLSIEPHHPHFVLRIRK
ncbi:hypothetical protein LshimejAT787_0404910 [Lyophyllum shimeji]|uniref:Uncharacterized protein n=1 Tax=Lyophyllum shimeji TaxID=47721 RepID=A0A9P3PJM9_LYOSH|nr:hypothetical protein LshimejAT787_0404910 [Lyophyllum shimeji]